MSTYIVLMFWTRFQKWHHWEGPGTVRSLPEPNGLKQRKKKASPKKARGAYRSYSSEQVQELLDLVIEKDPSAKKQKQSLELLSEQLKIMKQRVSWDKKLQPHHTEFLCELYDKTPQAVLWQARDALLEAFDEIESITLSGLHRHLASYASLTLKKLETFVRLQEQLLVISRCVETGFLSGKVMKTVFSLMRQVLACIFVENLGVIDLTLHKPKGCSEKANGMKKRKRGNGKTEEVEVNTRIGTRSEHFIEFLVGVMDTLDQFDIKGRYLIMDNAAIHKVTEIQNLITSRGYKATYLPPYSPFLNPIELFWSKIKGNIRRDCLNADDNLNTRMVESAKTISIDDCVNWISHSYPFFVRCLVLEPIL
ncbi:hypothetical protein G6F70_001059 [Rhizopus microsporus]|nr:hypothetical protein G6F71_002226 [Rhizopus microsporus]KAG1203823.1 hypothetical protein G6F70_001059 [Rhizopus microsporus]KAG1214264.1 hypothetical protein G6F69_002098 [Rhizopus microsporus]KAG1236785.1 hypothetical protein G6F67_001732 [Rhizopus microsporus]KAG1259208.1 hypothetical protein G6F68_008272 [Rhizopus microsporus]